MGFIRGEAPYVIIVMCDRMPFPKIGNKHELRPMFDKGFWMRDVPNGIKIPTKVIIIYANNLESIFVRELGLVRVKEIEDTIKNYNTLSIYKSTEHQDLLVLKLAIGAPFTAMVAEDFIRHGVKELLIIGEAGGIKQDLTPGSICLCSKALRDTGTSEHYLKRGRYINSDKNLTNSMKTALKKAGIKSVVGPTWSIDAPYTETREEVDRYNKAGVLTVEMEAAGLFAVAAKRGAQAGAVFIVSDVLHLETGWSGIDNGEAYTKGMLILPEIAKLFAQI